MPEPQIVSQAKFREEYQAKDEWGNPIGPPQIFEADTQKDLIRKLVAANENASAALYKTKRDAKLGRLLEEIDPETPIPTYEERALTADERVKLITAAKDPASFPETIKTIIEAQFGAPPSKIREALVWIEANDRANKARDYIYAFRVSHPDYVESESNRDVMQRYLEKHKMGVTKKNLEIAYEALKADGLLTIRAEKPPQVSAAPIPPSGQVQQTPPPLSETIPPSATPAAPISDPPAVVNTSQPATAPAPSSSGLSPRVGTAPQEVPKAKEMTATELSLIISRMTSAQYAKRCQEDKAFEALVNKLLK